MNSKVSKQLRELAKEESQRKGYPFNWTRKELKKLWITTPKEKKKTVFG